MAILTFKRTIPPASSLNDVLQNQRIAYVPTGAQAYRVRLYSTASGSGVEHELFIGGDNPLERSVVSQQNRIPVVPDDFVVETYADPGERIVLNLHNTDTTNARDYFGRIEVEPLVL